MPDPNLDKPLCGLGEEIPDVTWAVWNSKIATFQCCVDSGNQCLMIGLHLTESASNQIAESDEAFQSVEVTKGELARYIHRMNVSLGRLAISGVVLLTETGNPIQALYVTPQRDTQ